MKIAPATLARDLLAAAAAGMALVAPCAAQKGDAPSGGPSPLTVDVTLGARGVDVTGDETRYRQDANLDDGVRVLDFGLHDVPAERDSAVDRIELDAASLGGDPYEQLHLEVRKYGGYELDVDHRKSQYFYDDTIGAGPRCKTSRAPPAATSTRSISNGCASPRSSPSSRRRPRPRSSSASSARRATAAAPCRAGCSATSLRSSARSTRR